MGKDHSRHWIAYRVDSSEWQGEHYCVGDICMKVVDSNLLAYGNAPGTGERADGWYMWNSDKGLSRAPFIGIVGSSKHLQYVREYEILLDSFCTVWSQCRPAAQRHRAWLCIHGTGQQIAGLVSDGWSSGRWAAANLSGLIAADDIRRTNTLLLPNCLNSVEEKLLRIIELFFVWKPGHKLQSCTLVPCHRN